MVYIQINLTKKESRTVGIYKVQHDLPTKAEAIKRIIQKTKV